MTAAPANDYDDDDYDGVDVHDGCVEKGRHVVLTNSTSLAAASTVKLHAVTTVNETTVKTTAATPTASTSPATSSVSPRSFPCAFALPIHRFGRGHRDSSSLS